MDSRLTLEIAFARMGRPDLHASPASLLARIERLERIAGVEAGGEPEAEAPKPRLQPVPPPAVPVSAPDQAAPPPAVEARGDLDIERIRRAWPTVMDGVKRRKIRAHAMLLSAVPASYTDGEVVLQFPPASSFHRDRVAEPGSGLLPPLVEAFYETFGVRPAVSCVLGQNEPREPATPKAGPPAGEEDSAATIAPPKDPIDLIREGFAAEIVEETMR